VLRSRDQTRGRGGPFTGPDWTDAASAYSSW
jgi:hypothetical protein